MQNSIFEYSLLNFKYHFLRKAYSHVFTYYGMVTQIQQGASVAASTAQLRLAKEAISNGTVVETVEVDGVTSKDCIQAVSTSWVEDTAGPSCLLEKGQFSGW